MHRPTIIIALLVCASINAVCQQRKVDSLQNLLLKSKGEARAKVLHELIVNTWLNYPDSAKQYAREAVHLSDQLNDLKLRSISNRLLGLSFAYLGNYDSGLFYGQRAVELAIECRDSTEIASSLNHLGVSYLFMGSYPEAFERALRAYKIRAKMHDKALARSINNLGVVYLRVADFKKARGYLNEAINVANRLKDENIKLTARHLLLA